MFAGDDEDGDFLSPTGGAKLASLFGLDQETSQGNESFQYTAPKQPKKSSNTAPASQKAAPPPGAPAVLLATAVQAFRYINGQYVKQGKLGAAVLGNHTTKEYKLLLYLSQQKQVTAAKIHVGFVFTVQPNNYCTFYDDQRQNWSLMFESEKASSDFCKEVCLAKANSAASLDTVVIQDLNLGEGQAVENGDSLEVVYTGWLLQNHAIGQNKDKLLRLKVGAGKVIKGWEEGMLGMKKAGSRLIVIPPNLAYGPKGVPNRVPSNSTLIFEAELRRVKFSKDTGSDRASVCSSSRDSAAPSPAPSPATSVENLTPEPPVQMVASGQGIPGEPPLRAKSNSLSEQLANPDATKAKLISRMAKMGQPMLPFLTGVASQPESSDSELEDTSGSRAKDRPAAPSPVQISTAAPPSAHAHPHPHIAPPSALVPVMNSVAPQPGLPGSSHAFQPYPYTQTSVAPTQLQPVGQVYPAQTVPYVGSSDVTSFLMTEARQHNTEIRLSVGKVADKVDQLASKIDDLQRQGSLSMGVSSMSMETSMIMHNIQRIVQENECLKKEVFEKSSRIEEQNRKIGELIDQNQRHMEQSNLLLEKRNDSLKSSSEQNQARLLQAEQDKVRLTEDLASSTARLSQLQLEASVHQQKAMELQNKLSSALQDSESHSQRIAAQETQLEELKEAAERTQAQYRSEKQRRKEMELKVNNMEEELQDLKTDKERLERTLLERKKKWQAERQRRDEEVEELRKSSQQELDNVRAQLRKARTSTDNAASEQLSQLQAELEVEWKGKCEQMLASAKEQHSRELAELTEQKDALQDKQTQLQEKFTVLKQARDLEEQSSLQHSRQTEELQALQEKPWSGKEQLTGRSWKEEWLNWRRNWQSRRVQETLQQSDSEASSVYLQVKRVMNGVFHSLRGEFDLSESYSGQAVLGVIVTTIKNVTLQLLSGTVGSSLRPSKKEEEEEEEEEEESDVKQTEEMPHQNVHVNGEREVKEEEEHVAESDSPQVCDTQEDQEVAAEKEKETVAVSQTQSQVEVVAASNLHPDLSAESKLQETVAESEAQQEQAVPVPETSTEERDTNKSADSDDEAVDSSQPQDGREETVIERKATVIERKAAVSSEVAKESVDDGEQVGEVNAASQKAFGPPANPPPPPHAVQNSSREDTSLTGGMGVENGEEPFFQNTSPAKPPAAPSEEEEEDELSLKGHPPPAPLFGDDEDDDDLDWLS
ncbi:FK506-binding protein 15 [Collichthys lucidus]|uniref:peptidylprolyl isomerase n=1 Tax=Collichthys lucidus TaxID=240159 RepID=A0A4U5USB7_COLLU|nr:FK506-binding protein 15 [Collichthys lucidus]TKS78024.1 FK506-binding protein 15 [Collichthys lucidus]